MLIIPSNIAAPTAFTVRFYAPALGFDLTSVSAVQFAVLRHDGTTTTWVATIVSQTQTEIVAQYFFVGGEITTTGAYLLAPQLSVSGGFIPGETISCVVRSPFQCTPKLEGQSWVSASSLIAGTLYAPTWVQTPLWGAELVPAGSPYTLPTGNTPRAVNLTSGNVQVNVVNGASDGETKRFVSTSLTNPLSSNTFVIFAQAGNLYAGTNDGVASTSVNFTGQFDVTMTWIAAANNNAGGWYL